MANPEHYVRRWVSLEGETMLRFYQGLRKVGPTGPAESGSDKRPLC